MDEYLESVVDRAGVRFDEEVWSVDREELAGIQARDDIKGGVVVTVVNQAGELLLIRNDWMDGYGLPGGGVEADEDWEAAAVREAAEETGVAVELVRPWRVLWGRYECDGEVYDGEYTVFYLARPADDGQVGDELGVENEPIEAAAWFDGVPDDAFQPELLELVFEAVVADR